MAWFYVINCICLTSIGHIILKYYTKSKILKIFFSSISFLIATIFSYFSLKELSLSNVYLSMSLVYIVVIFIEKVFFKIHIKPKKIIGILITLSGIMIYFYSLSFQDSILKI